MMGSNTLSEQLIHEINALRQRVAALETSEYIARAGVADSVPRLDNGYLYVTTLYYTSPGTHQFVKANYPWLRLIRATVTGAGGGGGGSGGQNYTGGGSGGAGGTAIIELNEAAIAALPSSANVVVGAGGAGGAVGANNGSPGGNSTFAGAQGGGGSGGYRHNADVAGGTGANGIVVLELYA